MNEQVIFNWAVGLLGPVAGWWLKVMWSEIKEIKHEGKELADRVAGIDVLVAGQYVKREYFEAKVTELSTALFNKLDRIEDKIDRKADKPNAG